MNKKLLLTLSAGLLAMGGLAACGKTGDGKVHVKFWHTMGQNNEALLNRMIAEFEETNPDVKIEAYSQGGYGDIAGKIGDAIPAGTTPTMSFCYPDNVANYMTAGAIEDLTPYVDNEEYGLSAEDKADFVKSYWDEGTNYAQSGVYSVPYAKSTEAIFYNKTVFAENGWTIPTTWEQMWTLCSEIVAKFPQIIPLGYDSDSNLFITWCEQNGYNYTSQTGEHFAFNNADTKAMVKVFKEHYDAKHFFTKGTQPNATYTSTKFTNQELLMSIGSTGGTTYNKSLNFEVGVAPIPSGTLNGHVVSQGPSICLFKRATSQEKIAAWKFYKHITSTDNSAAFAIATGYEPVRTSSYNCPQYTAHLATAFEQDGTTRNLLAAAAMCTKENYANRYFYSPVFDGSAIARDEVGGIVSQVLLLKNLSGKALDDKIDEIFDQAIAKCIM